MLSRGDGMLGGVALWCPRSSARPFDLVAAKGHEEGTSRWAGGQQSLIATSGTEQLMIIYWPKCEIQALCTGRFDYKTNCVLRSNGANRKLSVYTIVLTLYLSEGSKWKGRLRWAGMGWLRSLKPAKSWPTGI